MTKDEIGDMIAALPQGLAPDDLIFRLVNWAVDQEREACAKLADDWPDYNVQGLAEAIRTRGDDDLYDVWKDKT